MQKHFYNTTHQIGMDLHQEIKKAYSQEQEVKTFFASRKSSEYTCAEIYQIIGWDKKRIPLTSLRRCVTNLYKKGCVVKIEKKRIGIYGKPNYTYKHI